MKHDDILWKAILEDIFDDFLKFFIPDAEDIFDLQRGFEYLDKELQQSFPSEKNKIRYVDKLVKVFTRSGSEEWILVHVEVQGYKDKHFARRMFQYYSRIWDRYDKQITAFAIFTDGDHRFHPATFEQSFLGTSIIYTFNTYKISGQSEPDLLKSSNPFALVVLTVKAALKGKKLKEHELFNIKLNLAKLLLSKQISKTKIRNLMFFLQYYIRFESKEMISNFDREIEKINPTITTMGIEEFLLDRARKEGMEKGMEKAQQLIIGNLLQKGTYTIVQIAEIAGVSVGVVRQVKKKLKL